MTIKNRVGRVSVYLAGLAGAALLAAGCSSDSNGNPPAGLNNPGTSQSSGTGGPIGGSNQGGTTQGGSTNQGGGGSQGGPTETTPTGPGDPAAFCKDFNSIGSLQSSGYTSPAAAKRVLNVWKRMVEEAPPQIRPDVQTIENILENIQSGHVDPSKFKHLAQVDEHIINYAATHC